MFPLFQTTGKVTITELRTASEKYKPRIFIDGDMWCALYGENIQDGVVGFGKSPQEAMDDFDKNFTEELTPRPSVASITFAHVGFICPVHKTKLELVSTTRTGFTLRCKKCNVSTSCNSEIFISHDVYKKINWMNISL